MTEEKALVPREEAIVIYEKPQVVVQRATEQAKALMDIVEKRKLFKTIQGKDYLVVEAWEIIGAFNRVHALTDYIRPIDGNEGNLRGYEAKVSLIKDGEPVGSAIMSCGLDEFPCQGKDGEAKHKACRSAAQTWAESKAYRMNFSWVAVLAGFQPTPAEEMEGSQFNGSQVSDSQDHWCPIHNTAFFKRGKMKFFAHPIVDGKGWCNEATVKKQQQEAQRDTEPEPPIEGLEPVQEPLVKFEVID